MKKDSNYIDDSEKIGRFIFSRSEFSSEKKEVKAAAFMPAPKDNRASVYRINGYSEEKISILDKNFVSGKRKDGKKSKARADVCAKNIREVGLELKSEPNPHKDHANIEGYTSIKSENKSKALKLAMKATLVINEE